MNRTTNILLIADNKNEEKLSIETNWQIRKASLKYEIKIILKILKITFSVKTVLTEGALKVKASILYFIKVHVQILFL